MGNARPAPATSSRVPCVAASTESPANAIDFPVWLETMPQVTTPTFAPPVDTMAPASAAMVPSSRMPKMQNRSRPFAA